GNHLGQWPCAATPKGRTYGSKRSDQKICKKHLQGGAVHIRDEGRRRRSPPKSFLQRRASYETRIALRAAKTAQSFNAIIDLAEAVINSK
ncbi:hypothetical protein ACFHWW_13410, partial [Ensifer sp. P24N7]